MYTTPLRLLKEDEAISWVDANKPQLEKYTFYNVNKGIETVPNAESVLHMLSKPCAWCGTKHSTHSATNLENMLVDIQEDSFVCGLCSSSMFEHWQEQALDKLEFANII